MCDTGRTAAGTAGKSGRRCEPVSIDLPERHENGRQPIKVHESLARESIGSFLGGCGVMIHAGADRAL